MKPNEQTEPAKKPKRLTGYEIVIDAPSFTYYRPIMKTLKKPTKK